jgi:predicted unusual protein kinase regulating ubiquinone biosynthesis (AarF/ABC1/UbiB family)
VPWSIIVEDVERELEAPLVDLFADFELEPIGSASLGQAHAARLKDGTEVVVKVLHRDIDKSVRSDLRALRTLLKTSRLLQRDNKEIDGIFLEVQTRLEEELDYYREAANIEFFRKALADVPGVVVPATVPALSTSRVLTMERLRGQPISTFLETASKEARDAAGQTLATTFHEMLYRHRTLHSDPHPGNFLFGEDGTVGLLDFGCVKRFETYFVADYARIASAAVAGEKESTLEFARTMGVLEGHDPAAEQVFWDLCSLMVIPFQAPHYQAGSSDDNLQVRAQKLVPKMLRHPQIKSPPELIYLNRTLIGTYAMLRRLHLDTDYGAMFRRYADHAVAVAEGRVEDGQPVSP